MFLKILSIVCRILSLVTLVLGFSKIREPNSGQYRENMYLLSITFANLASLTE